MTGEMFLGVLLGILLGSIIVSILWMVRLHRIIQKERKSALTASRAVLKGQISEQLAPLLPSFPCQPSEVAFIGKPVDFVAFPGLAEGDPREILLLDVKTGNAQLSATQKKIQTLAEKKQVRFAVYRPPSLP